MTRLDKRGHRALGHRALGHRALGHRACRGVEVLFRQAQQPDTLNNPAVTEHVELRQLTFTAYDKITTINNLSTPTYTLALFF